jgi:hypothetical protein
MASASSPRHGQHLMLVDPRPKNLNGKEAQETSIKPVLP